MRSTSFGAKLDALRKSLARTQALAARKSDAANVKSELAELTATPCDQLDVAAVGRQAAALRARYPKDAATIDGADHRVDRAMRRRDRSKSIRTSAVAAPTGARCIRGRAGAHRTETRSVRRVEPRRARVASPGGFCADDLGGGLNGPRLVVVADGDHRFAIGKFEVSFADIAPFCAETLRCNSPTAATHDQPATGVGVEQAAAYAEWLSQRSGHSLSPADARGVGARRARRMAGPQPKLPAAHAHCSTTAERRWR